MLLPNLSFTPAVPGLRAVPTGDAGDAQNDFKIRETLNTVKVMRAEQKFPNGPPKANGEAGEWKTTNVKTPGCCGFDGAKEMTVWVFDENPKTGIEFVTQQEVELFTGRCSAGAAFFCAISGAICVIFLALAGTGIGIFAWQASIDRTPDWAKRPPPPPGLS
tara:strand:- start:2278 stop:2763 length:486 start_codon:yes stop_codon:yes gene_type:complete